MQVEADARRLEPARKATTPRNRPSMKQPMLSSEQPLSVKAPHRSIAQAAAHGDTFFTPHQSAVAYQMAKHNDPLGTLGKHIENFLQLKQIGQQAVHMFDPRTKNGVANIAGMFAGGPEGDSADLLNSKMPGQFEKYDVGKAMGSN